MSIERKVRSDLPFFLSLPFSNLGLGPARTPGLSPLHEYFAAGHNNTRPLYFFSSSLMNSRCLRLVRLACSPISAFAVVCCLLVNACSLPSARSADPGLLHFASLLTGEFSSAEQAKRDTSYFNIHLSMSRIWSDRSDGVWLYVEQAMDARRDKPYRQRVYQLTRGAEGDFVSEIYTIKNAADVIGLQNSAAKKSLLTPNAIERKEGCAVHMRPVNDAYEGGTVGSACPSDLRGASYATTVITLKQGELVSWDRGFDAKGNQVWGAVNGGYVFVKQ